MSVTYVGSYSVGSANLAVAAALPVLSSLLSDLLSRIASLQGQIDANASIIATPPDPTALAAQLAAAAASAVASITAIVASVPTAMVQANASLGADLGALLALRASLQTIVDTFSAAASAGGLHVLAVDSTPAQVGGELGGAVSGGMPGGGLPTARIRGALYLTEDPATFSTFSGLFRTGA